MHTIVPHYAPTGATAHLIAASLSASAGGLKAGIATVLVIAFLAVVASAARGFATLLSGLLRLAATVTSLLFTAMIVIAVAAVVLAHR